MEPRFTKTIEYSHYIAKLKEHEENRTSTNDRNEYWKMYGDYKLHVPKSKARFEHG